MENSEERIKVLSKTEILVNLDAPPELPFDGATIESNTSSTCGIGSGWVRVEKREAEGPDSGRNGLYVDGHRVILYLSKQQKRGKMIRGNELREELIGKPVLHPNIMDALLEHLNLIPEDWKNDKSEDIYYIFFWAVIFRRSDGSLCVRSLCFDGDGWDWCYHWLDGDWGGHGPAALLES